MQKVSSDIEQMRSMYNTAVEQIKMIEDMNERLYLDPYNFPKEIFHIIRHTTVDNIKKFTYENCVNVLLLLQYYSTTQDETYFHRLSWLYEESKDAKSQEMSSDDSLDDSSSSVDDKVKDSYEGDEGWLEYVKKIFLEIKDTTDQLDDLYKSRDEIKDTIEKMESDYMDYISSDEYKTKKAEALAARKKEVEEMPDGYEKRKALAAIESTETAHELNFLYERLDKIGKKELEKIKDAFFTRESTFAMKRFTDKITRIGFKEGIHRVFFNLEEKFLPEEYHPYNNLFLFHTMRYISHIDTNDNVDVLYTKTVMQQMYKLVYHKFGTQEEENAMIEKIKKLDDYFKDYEEYFKEKNRTSPDHNSRKQREAKYDAEVRMNLINSLLKLGVEPDTSVETSELKALLEETLEKNKKEREDSFNEAIKQATYVEPDESEVTEEVTAEQALEESEGNSIEVFEKADQEQEEITEESDEPNDGNHVYLADSYAEFYIPTYHSDTTKKKEEDHIIVSAESNDGKVNESDESTLDITSISDDTQVYVDKQYAVYIQKPNGKYDCYYKNERCEQDVSEEDVLRLASGGFVTKKNFGDIKEYLQDVEN